MNNSPVTLSRRHVLGELYSRCEHAENIPVYLNDTEKTLLGHVDESLGTYADAFTFHLSDDYCKKLSAGHFTYGFDYEYADNDSEMQTAGKRMIQIVSITLIMRKGYNKPVSKKSADEKAAVESVA